MGISNLLTTAFSVKQPVFVVESRQIPPGHRHFYEGETFETARRMDEATAIPTQ